MNKIITGPIKSHNITPSIFIIILLFILFWNISTIPSTSALWDEGWTMLVAKNWVDIGHYGQLIDGNPTAPGLSAAYPVVLPVAASFSLLGVGVWQGRLPIVLMTLGMFLCLFLVGRKLGGYKIGMGAIWVALLMSPHPLANPIYMGRQVMAEVPLLFFCLAGYICFLHIQDRFSWIIAAILFWGLALQTKAQMAPFLSVALLVPLGMTLLKRQWRLAAYFATTLVGAWLGRIGLSFLWSILIQGHTVIDQPLGGLAQPLALTLDPISRRSAMLTILLIGVPTVVSLIYLTVKIYRRSWQQDRFKQLIWVSIIIFSGSWLTWYLVLSIGWVRYVMPALLVGSILVAQTLSDLTNGFDVSYSVKQIGNTLLKGRIFSRQAGLFWMFVIVLPLIFLTVKIIYLPIGGPTNMVVYQVVDYIHNNTNITSRVECYETEILFLINRPYHYPPDQVSVEVLEQWTDEDKEISYDPIPSDPDILVIGPYARGTGIYDDALAGDQFDLLEKIGIYGIYQRTR